MPGPASMPRSSSWPWPSCAAAGLAEVQLRLNSHRRRGCRPAYVEALRAYFGQHEADLPDARARAARARTRSACWTRRTSAWRPSSTRRRSSTRTSVPPARSTSSGVHGPPRRGSASSRVLDADASCAASTTTPAPPSSSTGPERRRTAAGARRRRALRRPRRAAGRSADARHRLRYRPRPGRPRPRRGGRRRARTSRRQPDVVVVGADPDGHHHAGCGSRRTCAAPGWPRAPDLGSRKLGKQLESAAREGAHFAVICGDELAAASVQSCATSRPARSARSRRGPGAGARARAGAAPARSGGGLTPASRCR